MDIKFGCESMLPKDWAVRDSGSSQHMGAGMVAFLLVSIVHSTPQVKEAFLSFFGRYMCAPSTNFLREKSLILTDIRVATYTLLGRGVNLLSKHWTKIMERNTFILLLCTEECKEHRLLINVIDNCSIKQISQLTIDSSQTTWVLVIEPQWLNVFKYGNKQLLENQG